MGFAPHATYSGNATVTLPTSTGTLLLTDGDGSSLTNIVTQITAGDGISVSGGGTGNVTLSTTVAGIEVGSTFPNPATATEGDTFYNTNYGKIFIHYDGFWVDTSPASGSGSGSSNLISSSTTNGTNAVTSTTTTSEIIQLVLLLFSSQLITELLLPLDGYFYHLEDFFQQQMTLMTLVLLNIKFVISMRQIHLMLD